MLPISFLSTYQKYKRDTDVVATWLVATAKQRGYEGALSTPVSLGAGTKTTSAPPPSRLKGKARKAAKEQQRQQATPSSKDEKDPSLNVKHVLAIRDFVPLAEFIADQMRATQMEVDDGPAIPPFLMTALERTIRVRKSFSARLSEVEQHRNDQADATHTHFVDVLEKVCFVLRKCNAGRGDALKTAPRDGVSQPVRDGSTKRDKPRGYNIFDLLQVFEPSDDASTEPDVVDPAPSSLSVDVEFTAVDVKYTPEYSEHSEPEAVFAFTALLKDLFSLREEIRDLWEDYSNGKLDLAATAVSVNIALELARTMEEEVTPLLVKYGGAITLLPKIFDAVCQSLGLDPNEKKLPSDDMNLACYDIGASFLWNIASLVDAIRVSAPDGSQGVTRYTGSFGWFDPQAANLETMSNRERWAQDKAAVLEVVPDLNMLYELKGIEIHDELARGFRTMFRTQYVPIWLCFAVQNYIDTLRFLGPKVKKTLAEFYHFNESVVGLLDRAATVEHSGDVDQELEDVRSMATVKKNGVDIFTVFRTALYHGSGYESEHRTSHFMLHNPVFCGMWIHYVRVSMHKAGVLYAATPGAVLHSVQLYTAVQQQQQQQQDSVPVQEWPDIGSILTIQGPRAFFIGLNPPTSSQAHFKNYSMSRGISPANWLAATKRRKSKKGKTPVLTSKAGIRHLKFSAPASMWCALRMEKNIMAGSAKAASTAGVVEEILNASGWFNAGKEEGEAKDDEVEKNEAAGIDETQAEVAAHGTTRAKTKSVSKLTASQLVRQFSQVIQTEIPDLTFNYFALHETAQRLLRKLQEQADDIGLPQVPNPQTDVADFAGLIFATAAGELVPESGQSEDVMSRVADVMRESLTEELDGTVISPGRLARMLTSKLTL
ncbi:hypothetical protein BKA56DRAFT_589718 [Ilyonectria sp. MPI-CAGE-AT-0026]|nr:hypothetical protein BKA56DRAFT_589718 [Ilyonectria sp. MPI-CAGE-AT-0026]